MAPSSPFALLCTSLVVLGSLLFLFFYHVRTRRFDAGDRTRITSWRFYGAVDVYLKASTLAITVWSLNSDSLWLLKIHQSIPIAITGLLTAGFALLLFATAMRTLDQQFTPAHQSHLPEWIVRTGPYRLIRHPIYTANLLLMTGLFLLSGSLWIVMNLLILITYYIPTIRIEERALLASFPDYRNYAQTTGRIFPRWHWSSRNEDSTVGSRRKRPQEQEIASPAEED